MELMSPFTLMFDSVLTFLKVIEIIILSIAVGLNAYVFYKLFK